MRFALTAATLAAVAATVSAQQNFQVQVGANGSLAFNPTSINANQGDTVSFLFMAKNHTVTQSTFPAPCEQMTTPSLGVDSGFQPVAANATSVPSFTITVNATTPLWFYCKQTGHCEKGMVFAVNPTANKSFEAFQAAANASSSTGAPASNSSSSSSSSTSGSSTSTSSSSSPSASAKSGAGSNSVRAGGLLAAAGIVAGMLL